MAFPKNSKQVQAAGRIGTKASENPAFYAAGQTVAGAAVQAGLFAWGTQPADAKSVYSPIKYANKGTGIPSGIISGETMQTYLCEEEASMTIPAGATVLVITRGDVFVKTETAAEAGQKVFASLADGKIKTGAAGATVADAIETDFRVITSGAASDIIIISNN